MALGELAQSDPAAPTSTCVTTTADRLLDAVDVVIGERGPSGVTLRQVGAQAGVSHTAAAHYYRDKPGLFTAYITRAYNRVADALDEAALTSDPRAAMLDAAGAYANFALESPAAFSVLQRLDLARVDTPELWAARERCYFGIDAIIGRLQAEGWAEGRDIRDLLATSWSFVHGFVDLWVGGPMAAPYDGDELVATLRRIFDDLISAMAGPEYTQ